MRRSIRFLNRLVQHLRHDVILLHFLGFTLEIENEAVTEGRFGDLLEIFEADIEPAIEQGAI
jgi:hypothetical protein